MINSRDVRKINKNIKVFYFVMFFMLMFSFVESGTAHNVHNPDAIGKTQTKHS